MFALKDSPGGKGNQGEAVPAESRVRKSLEGETADVGFKTGF